MNIHIDNQQQDLSIDAKSVEEIVLAFLQLEQVSADEVSINFVDDPTICKLHADYFNDPTTTDCISFPMDGEDEEYRLLGEIFVCPKTAIDYARLNGIDPYTETTLYIVHGLLHLIGLDDIEDEDRDEMRRREQVHLENLKKLNLQVKKI